MTTENTNTMNETTEKNEKKTKKASAAASASSLPSESVADRVAAALGFEYEFLPLPTGVSDGALVTLDPKTVAISKLDARTAPAIVDAEFIESVKQDGLIQDPCVTYARHRKTGKEGWIAVAGRRRLTACVQIGRKEINAKAKAIRDIRHYLLLAGKENLQRDSMTFWDKFVFLQNLMSTGLKQSELKGELNVSEGNISQILAVGKLDERVQKIVREGTKEPFKSFAASVVRELKRVSDPEVQVHFAQVAVEKNLSPSAVKFEIEKYLDKQQRAADGGGEKGEKGAKGSKGGRGVKLPEEVVAKDVKLVAKTDIVTLFNFSAARFNKLKGSDKTKPETLAYERGRRDALAQVAGLVPLPTKAAESEE